MFADVLVALRRTDGGRPGRSSSPPTTSRSGSPRATARGDRRRGARPQRRRRAAASRMRRAARRRAGAAGPGRLPAAGPGRARRADRAPRRRRARSLIVPDRHGTGTNALLLTPPGAFAPSFGPGSRARHEQTRRAAGLEVADASRSHRSPSTSTRPRTWPRSRPRWPDSHGGAAHTRGMLRQLARIREYRVARDQRDGAGGPARGPRRRRPGRAAGRRAAAGRPRAPATCSCSPTRSSPRPRAGPARLCEVTPGERARDAGRRAGQGPAPCPGRARRVARDPPRRRTAC